MPAYLLMRLEAPLMSFGTVAVDQRRPVQPWPAASMLTGLLANALGWTQAQTDALDALQARLRWAARIDRPGVPLADFQTAQLAKADQAWTTRGAVQGRDGGDNTYHAPHLRYRDYRADASVLVAICLVPAERQPTLAELARALDTPARPLFIGRKGCPPATRIASGVVDAEDAVVALHGVPGVEDGVPAEQAAIYFNEGASRNTQHLRVHLSSDERRFGLDVHAGRQRIYERPAQVRS